MNLYRILLFVHVLGAVLWLGGGFMFQLLAERAVRSNDAPYITRLLDDAERLGNRFFMPNSIVVLATGIWLVFEGDWGFGHVFVIGGLAGYAASAVIGGAILTPVSKRAAEGLRGKDAVPPEVRAVVDRLRMLSWIDVGVLTLVVFLMTTKPGT